MIDGFFSDLEQKARNLLRTQNISEKLIEIQTAADMRYARQSYELTIHFDLKRLKQKGFDYLNDLFHREHERAYGFAARDEEIKIVNLKAIGLGKIKKHVPPEIQQGSKQPIKAALKEMREVHLDDTGASTRCAVYDREPLRCGNVIGGPAIIEEVDSTTVILPDYQGRVDRYGNLIVSKQH
jgi:N-methylhydantoinase A